MRGMPKLLVEAECLWKSGRFHKVPPSGPASLAGFDANGAALILEDLDHALERGAPVLAELTGYGMSADAYHITLPRPGGSGAARAMVNAVDDAGLTPEEIGYINAHGTSTPWAHSRASVSQRSTTCSE